LPLAPLHAPYAPLQLLAPLTAPSVQQTSRVSSWHRQPLGYTPCLQLLIWVIQML
jgi:hypothetical protein